MSHQVDPPGVADQERYSSSINLMMTTFLYLSFYVLCISTLFLSHHQHGIPYGNIILLFPPPIIIIILYVFIISQQRASSTEGNHVVRSKEFLMYLSAFEFPCSG